MIIHDDAGRPLAGIRVVFFEPTGLQIQDIATGADGTASATWVLGKKVTTYTLVASSDGVGNVEFTANAHAGPAAQLINKSPIADVAAPGGTRGWPPVVAALDVYGNPIAGLTVAYALSGPATATIEHVSSVTDVNGVTSAGAWTLGTVPGNYSLTATVPNTPVPVLIFQGRVNTPFPVRSISAGGAASCATLSDGTAYCWGDYLGNETRVSTTPVRVASTPPLDSLSLGTDHACGLTSNGAAYCWGTNVAGQLGTGDVTLTKTEPSAVAGNLSFSSLSLGNAFTCGLTSDGTAYCWGDNTVGQLGDGTLAQRSRPTPVNTTERFRLLTAGFEHACGVTLAGATFCWGVNDHLQLDAVSTGSCPVLVPYDYYTSSIVNKNCSTLPIPIQDQTAAFTSLSAATGTCGLDASGAAYCWGFGSRLFTVDTKRQFMKLALGEDMMCGLTTLHAVVCWTYTDVWPTTPTEILSGATALTAGRGHFCAIAGADGMAVCWGLNDLGELGNGTRTTNFAPLPVSKPTS
ncbi:MAG TPA: hypothetical protein VJW73_21460 [Gemmatimonadaceae bacterium]|nr:hypothetical protein [Gemmatimonadaceae bacterium]